MPSNDIYSDDTTKDVKVQQVENFQIKGVDRVKLSKQGQYYAETLFLERRFARATIKKLDKERYMVMGTGEIRNYTHNESKQIPDLLRTFARLKALIRTNFESEAKNQLFVTLTYKENMTDAKQLYKDFNNFMKRLKYEHQEHNFQYIAVAEPQERGAWHFHVMLKTDKNYLFIDNRNMERIWRHGITETKRLKSTDVGQYYVTYFTDIVNEHANVKKRKKGARLHLYPVNFKFYRCSRGIIQPEITEEEWKDVVKMYGNPVYQVAYQIMEIDMVKGGYRTINTIHRASFRKKKRKVTNNEENNKRNVIDESIIDESNDID